MTTPHVPTVEEILDATSMGYDWHELVVQGEILQITTYGLRAVLNAAYDPSVPNWLETVTLDDLAADDA